MQPEHEKINYLELPSRNLKFTREFFSKVFSWQFTDYSADYIAFANAGIEGGFYTSDQVSIAEHGSALVIFYSKDLSATQEKIQSAGGKISKPVFEFPGGRRFHFIEPGGNEFAVWSDI